MNSLIGTQPTAIHHLRDSTLFFFGANNLSLHSLPGNAQFDIVYSPKDQHGWEFVHYQLFAEQNGISVQERRALEPDEIAYFECLLTISNAQRLGQVDANYNDA